MTATPLRLLFLEDSPADAELVLHALRRAGYDPAAQRVETEPEFREQLRAAPEVILADFSLPEYDAISALAALRDSRLDIPFIIVSGTIGEERAVEAMRLGAADYVFKDRLERLGQAVANALEQKALRDEARVAESLLGAQHAATRALADAADLEAAVPQTFGAVCTSMGWQWAATWMAAPRDACLRLGQFWHAPSTDAGGFLAACREKTFAKGEGLPGRVWATGEPVWVADVMQDENFFGKPAAAAAGLHAAFAFPIMFGPDVVGVIEFLSRRIERPDDKVLEMMAAVGSQLGQFIGRKRADEGLRLFRALIDHTTDGVEVIDPQTGRFLDVNETACAAHGYTRAEYLKLNVADIDPLLAAAPWAEVTAARRLGAPTTVESRHRRKDGTTFPVEVNLTFVRVGREYLVAVVRDITDRKLLEDQFRQAQKMEAFGQLAGGVAHDFNNLLTIIMGYSEMLLAALPPGDRNRGRVEEIHTAGGRAAALTRQLLAFSRKQVVEMTALDINGVVAGSEEMLGRLIGEDVTLTAVPAPGLGRVQADPGQVGQVIMNLVVNARDALPHGGRITIETADVRFDEAYARAHAGVAPGRYVMLAVSDDGSGMTEDVRRHMFEPFFTTKRSARGPGSAWRPSSASSSRAAATLTSTPRSAAARRSNFTSPPSRPPPRPRRPSRRRPRPAPRRYSSLRTRPRSGRSPGWPSNLTGTRCSKPPTGSRRSRSAAGTPARSTFSCRTW